MNGLKTLTTSSRVAGVLLTAVLLAGLAVAFFVHDTSAAFAATLTQTCAQAPSFANCDGQDPIAQGCAADATTTGQADITENNIVIGSVERRYSPTCNSWWGRIFDTRSASQAQMSITVAGTTTEAAPTFIGDTYRILYSPMMFDALNTPAPVITGSLFDGDMAAPSATIPAV